MVQVYIKGLIKCLKVAHKKQASGTGITLVFRVLFTRNTYMHAWCFVPPQSLEI